jgi:rhamnose utilization protein RhaD (predicted bifunctional aldolase and dehydrogenase)
MQNRWNDAAAAACADQVALRVYSSRLIGSEPGLVLYGGGNTSLKTSLEDSGVLLVKGSGSDLGRVAATDFTPLSLGPLRAMLALDRLPAADLTAALRPHILGADAPRPSIETLMHAALPWKFVEHTHAGAVLAICNTVNGEMHIRAAFGGEVVVPYHHSGFDLARACAAAYAEQYRPGMRGMVLMHHGACAWGATARASYEAMIALANRAEEYLHAHGAWTPGQEAQAGARLTLERALAIARLRRDASRAAGRALVATLRDDPFILGYARRGDLRRISMHGPATPGHAMFTKRYPQVGSDVAAFVAQYQAHLRGAPGLDAAPRVILDPGFGLLGLGVNKFYADAAADIYRSDAAVIARAEKLGGYATIDADLIRQAEIEYAGFEAKVAQREARAGRVVMIAGARGHRALIGELLASGSAVVALDTTPEVASFAEGAGYLGLQVHTSNPDDHMRVLDLVVRAFGGVDEIIGAASASPVFSALLEFAVP